MSVPISLSYTPEANKIGRGAIEYFEKKKKRNPPPPIRALVTFERINATAKIIGRLTWNEKATESENVGTVQ